MPKPIHDYCGKCRALRRKSEIKCILGYKIEKLPNQPTRPLEPCPKPMNQKELKQNMNRSIFD